MKEILLEIIKTKAFQLIKPVRLVVFTKHTSCKACLNVVELAHGIKTQMDKIALEIYDMIMDRDKVEQYTIQRSPALVVQGREGRAVTFYGQPEGIFLDVLLNTIRVVSESKIWFPHDIQRSLSHLVHDVKIRVFVENTCLPCKPVAETAINLALASEHIDTDIIMVTDFPELAKKYSITTLPKTIFGENLHGDGAMAESEFLDLIFQAEGVTPGPDRQCLVCGAPSPDVLCSTCKTRIHAEALEHKRKVEQQRQSKP